MILTLTANSEITGISGRRVSFEKYLDSLKPQ